MEIESDMGRPWGGFMTFSKNEECTVKILYIKPGGKLSLQKHSKRDESWHVVSGRLGVRTGASKEALEKRILEQGNGIEIKRGMLHDAENIGVSTAMILEVSRGFFDEGDIKRFEDIYGRA